MIIQVFIKSFEMDWVSEYGVGAYWRRGAAQRHSERDKWGQHCQHRWGHCKFRVDPICPQPKHAQ